MDFIPLPQNFYAPSAKTVARRLLGHWLLRRAGAEIIGGPIVETEAYLAGDHASHAFSGESPRNRVMFGPPGFAYVYFIYGVHFCVNAVCRPQGCAEAVLIRALEPAFGVEAMQANRQISGAVELANGPGKLCQALRIDRAFDGECLWDAGSGLILAGNPDQAAFCRRHGPVRTGPRVGITKAAELPLRFYLARSRFVSRTPARRTSGRSAGPAAASPVK